MVANRQAAEAYRSGRLAAESRIDDMAASLRQMVQIRSGAIRLLARDPAVRDALAGTARQHRPPGATATDSRPMGHPRDELQPALAALRARFRNDAEDIGLTDLGLLDAAGNCVVSGAEPGVRCPSAIRDRRLGAGRSGYLIVSHKPPGMRQLLLHAAVMDGNRAIGSLVGRLDLPLRTPWLDAESTFVSDANGVVVMARDPALLLRTLPGAAADRLTEEDRRRLYPEAPLAPLAFTPWRDPRFTSLLTLAGREIPVLWTQRRIGDNSDLTLSVLHPLPQLHDLKERRNAYTWILGILGSLVATVCINLLAYYRQRKSALDFLAAQEQKYRSLAENSPHFIVRWGLDRRITYVNARVEQHLGMSSEQLVGKAPSEVWPAGRLQELESALHQVLRQAEGKVIEIAEPRTDGRPCCHQIHLMPEFDRHGKIVAVLGFGQDIGAFKNAQHALAASRDFLDRIIDTIATPIFVKDRQHRWIHLNRAFCKLLGLPREALLGKSDFNVFPEHEARVFWEKDELVFTFCIENVNEEKVTDASGATRVAVTRKACFADENGQQFLVGVMNDITKRKQLEQALRDRDRELSTLVTNLPGTFSRFDKDGRFVYVNPRFEQLHGVRLKDVKGKTLAQVSGLADADMFEIKVRQAVLTARIDEFEHCASAPAGRWGLVCVVPELDDKGEVAFVQIATRDITRIKRHEAALLHSQEALRQAHQIARLGQWERDLVNHTEHWSEELFRILELAPDAAAPSPAAILAAIHPDDRQTVQEAHARSMSACGDYDVEYRLLFADGRIKHVQERGRTFGTAARPKQMLGTVQDITARKDTERDLRESRAKLKKLIGHREALRERERKIVARSLHEGLGQLLITLRLNLSMLGGDFGAKTADWLNRVPVMLGLLDQSIHDMRNAVTALRPAILDAGLTASLAWLASYFSERFGIPCLVELTVGNDEIRLDEEACTILFRIAQEALDNAVRHADANQISLELKEEDGELTLRVSDDGHGFDLPIAMSNAFGLMSMRERASMLGGRFRVYTVPGKGTSVVVSIVQPPPALVAPTVPSL